MSAQVQTWRFEFDISRKFKSTSISNQKMTSKWFKPLFNVEAVKNTPKKNEPAAKTPKQKVQSKKFDFKHNSDKFTSNINLLDHIEPQTTSDLAVHPKKIAEIENWFYNVLNGDRVSILLLTGPTGAGKTATVKVLCKTLNVEISEWVNSPDVYLEDMVGPGQTSKFTDFLTESSRYPSLFNTSEAKKVILVEEFPNSIIRNPGDLEPILQKFLDKGKSSLIFICTETKDFHTNLLKQLFPQSLQDSIGMTTISFNPVSATLLSTALKRCVSIIQEKYKHLYQIPSQATIESIVNSSGGDIRCALNNFNFAALKGSKDLPILKQMQPPPPVGTKRKRKTKEKGTLANMCKDQAVGILHGVGRVLYPKRIENSSTDSFEHSPEKIFNEFITQPKTFVNFLHENYINYFSNFHDICQGAEVLSYCDLLLNDWKDDDLIAHYGLFIAIEGLMVVNRKSEAKWNPVRGPKYIKRTVDEGNFNERMLKTLEKTYCDIIKNVNDKRFK